MNHWAVDVADDAITAADSSKELAKTLHEQHKFNRFTKADLQPIVEKLAPRFEQVCELLGVKSQRNDDGEINHRQVLTIVRNVFQVKTFAITNASLNGSRGVYVLVADDKAQAFRKGLIKAEKLKEPDLVEQGIAKARELYNSTHNRIEMRDGWMMHLDVERKQFRDFLAKQSYKAELLNDKRPDCWQSLPTYLEPFEKATAEAKEHPETDDQTLMFRLEYCQSYDEYQRIRAQLELHSSDFNGHYWPQLSAGAQERICSLYKAVAV